MQIFIVFKLSYGIAMFLLLFQIILKHGYFILILIND